MSAHVNATDFSSQFKTWHANRARISQISSELSNLKREQSDIFDGLLDMAQDKGIMGNQFRVGTEIFQFSGKSTWSSLSFKYVEQILTEKFGEENQELIGDIMARLKNGRTQSETIELKCQK